MLKNVSKLLTGDILKDLCDMGHGDELVIADANFPGQAYAKKLIRVPGISGSELLQAILEVFPLDSSIYVSSSAVLMDLTDGDKAKNMPTPTVWKEYEDILKQKPALISRKDFYERSKKTYVIIQCGEQRQYGNLILVKGVVL